MNEYYKEKLNEGIEYQDFIAEKLWDMGIPIVSYGSKKYQYGKGENRNGIEIKYDKKIKDTGNIYIEVAEKTNENNKYFVDSGIFRSNSWLYIIGDYETIYIFAVNQLKILYDNKKYREVETKTSKGYLLPVKEAKEGIAIYIIECGGVVN